MEVLGRQVIGFNKIQYNDETEQELVYGQGHFPIGKADGNYKATCSIALLFEERVALLGNLPPKTRIQDLPNFDITVMYRRDEKDYKDVIRNCTFKNNGVEANQNDKELSFDFELVCTHIDWNV
ncbi:hypothetical protein ElyMa_002564900 [Elysia marginata]|uniref:Uncharacterized protein n=1 Tax=Elysia marginata TaxID=1093978 RepID=A0AAV4GWR1_9GAST|nr:hypothetical protein ElyMa_002564900 [Elysia marginata]